MPTAPTLLIANRGEIALRILRTARRLGYRCAAVYSDADRGAPHCVEADLAVPLGAAAPAESYLNRAALLQAARQAGAVALHPGYGFFAENADFAQACIDAGLSWIGPPPQAIRAMGDKAEAKRLMQAAGVPCIPGYHGADQSAARMQAEAEAIGYPVMIKAAAGGGGRGMRRVASAAALADALQSARSEALHAFGSAEVILEKAIEAPRHIEIQVFADRHGQVVHLGERDCSVQRRHQKLIEEAPSPAVAADLRARMGAVAVAAARAIGYCGAGTLEFLLDQDGAFYFMEMNTRLQVEHAVTEALTGIDLVEWQLRIADGAALPLTQAQIDARLAGGGHAIEVRLCAEDCSRDFMPQSGVVKRWRAPRSARCDHALGDGVTVPPYYDSMLAKIIAHGSDRADALRRLRHALGECVLLGLASNRQFLQHCLAHPEFARGAADTGFIARHLPAWTAPATPEAVPVAAALLAWRRRQRQGARYPTELAGWSSGGAYAQALRFTLDGAAHACSVRTRPGPCWDIEHDGSRMQLQLRESAAQQLELVIDGVSSALDHAGGAEAQQAWFAWNGVEHSLCDHSDAPPRRDDAGHGGGNNGGSISAPMNGRVVALAVQAGGAVKAGELLLVIEAMKMEHSIVAPKDGVVQNVYASIGEQVAPGRLLLELELAA